MTDQTGDQTGEQEVAVLEAERVEIAEAVEAIRQALHRVTETEAWLRTAQDLSSADTWFGGGFLLSSLKERRIGQAQMTMRAVDLALETVRDELADVGVVEPIRSVGTEPIHTSLDVWFDNLVSDLMTHRRLKDAGARLVKLASPLTRVQSALNRRDRELAERIARLS